MAAGPKDSGGWSSLDIDFAGLMDSLGEGILYSDEDDVVMSANVRLAEMTGFSVAEMQGRRSYELFLPPEEAHLIKDRLPARLAGASERYEILLLRKDGSRFWAQVTASPVRNAKGIVAGSLGAIIDISDRKDALEKLSQQRAFLRETINANPSLIFTKNRDGRFTLVNKAFGAFYGIAPEDMIGKTDADLRIDPADLQRFREEDASIFESHEPKVIAQHKILHPVTGEPRWVQALKRPISFHNGVPAQVLVVVNDITERVKAEESALSLHKQLLQSQKMDAIGKLAAGVAHDLNNALGAVGGHLQLIQQLSQDSEIARSADVALQGCNRAARLIQQLLTFSRKASNQFETLPLRKIVNETVDFLSGMLGEKYRVMQDGMPGDVEILGDPGELEQALTNLILNAKSVMPDGGTISITYSLEQVQDALAYNPEARGTEFVVLSVRDSGPGMSAQVMEKLFEPFFTTRADKGGTGLGLSMVYGIMQHHGGWVRAESSTTGAVFKLYFPANASRPAVEESNGANAGSVLIIDDEQVLVDLALAFLRRAGIEARGFTAARDAVEWFRAHHHEVNVTLLDMRMAGMNGQECFAALRSIDPDAKIAVISGYADRQVLEELLAMGAVKYFEKPVKYTKLIDWISDEVKSRPKHHD